MDNIAGSPVEGEDFFGRQSDVDRLKDILLKDDVLLLGPRRIGKTSIARAVMGRVRAEGWRAVEINVASCIDEKDFLHKLNAALTPELQSLGSKVTGAFTGAMEAVSARLKSVKLSIPGGSALDVGLGAPETDWTEIGCDFVHLLAQVEQRWLVYVDELPIMLFNIIRQDTANGVHRVRRFLDWFRNDVRAVPGAHTVRWLVSGSVGLDTLVQQHRMADTINSLSHQSLAPFPQQTAIAMLMLLEARYQIGLTPAEAMQIVNEVQWSQPYYLQVAFHHLRGMHSAAPAADLASLVPGAINKMTEPGTDNDFHQLAQRLELQLDHSNARHARALLTLACQRTSGERPEALLAVLEQRLPNMKQEDVLDLFVSLRDILERDGYWWRDSNSETIRYRFRLEPLRRWWLRRNTL